MRTFTTSEFKLFEQIVGLRQSALKKVMVSFLKKHYPKVVETADYVYCEGGIPIALAAHLDTVFDKPPHEIFYDRQKDVIFSPQGLGADDRAGIFAILRIVQSGLRPHIILTTDEEKGCIGASVLGAIECPFADLRYIIELDRRGSDDCVFYDCDNRKFVDYVESFGFIEAYGSFTDICCICEYWEVAGVNLSVGYRDEHSYTEVLFVKQLLATIEKVKKMLTVTDIPKFEFIPNKFYYAFGWGTGLNGCSMACHKCKKVYMFEELIPTIDKDKRTFYYCPDCLVGNVNWCSECGNAFEGSGNFCPFCKGDKVSERTDKSSN